MGQALSEIFADPKVDEIKANDALNSLLEVARLRQDDFAASVKSSTDNSLIPIKLILSYTSLTRVSVDMKDGDTIGKMVGEALGEFSSGEIQKGIVSVATNALNLILGNFASNQSSKRTYVVSIGSNLGLVRIDTDFYAYQYNSTDLQAICKNVLAASVIISSIETTGLDKNTLHVLVGMVYGELPADQQQKIYEQIEAALKEDTSSLHYKRLNGLAPPYIS